MASQRIADQRIVEYLTAIVLPQSAKLVAKASAVPTFCRSGLALDLVEPNNIAVLSRRLDQVGTWKRVTLQVYVFLLRLGRPNVPAHPTDHLFVEMAHKALDDHKRLVCNGRADCTLKVAAVQKRLSGGQDIGIKNITRIASPFDVFGTARKPSHDGPDFFYDETNGVIRLNKCTH